MPLQRAKKKKRQRVPNLKERSAQSERDKAEQPALQAQIANAGGSDDAAWDVATQATAPSLPQGYTSHKAAAGSNLENMGLEADTNFDHPSQQVSVRYDENVPTHRSDNRRIGRLAQTFTHELSVHGQHALAHQQGNDNPNEDHNSMHDPATRTNNAYHDAVRAALPALGNDFQRKSFIKAWHDDMRQQIETSTTEDGEDSVRLSKGERMARKKWAKGQKRRLEKKYLGQG